MVIPFEFRNVDSEKKLDSALSVGQSARTSKIRAYKWRLTRSGTGRFVAVPIWQQTIYNQSQLNQYNQKATTKHKTR